jgi:chromosome segregation ATPase
MIVKEFFQSAIEPGDRIQLGVREVRILVGGTFVALAIALAFIVWDSNLDVLATVFLSQPGPNQIAWMIVLAASLLLLWLALWQSEMLSKQRKVVKTLEHRLRGVGQNVHRLEAGQSNLELAENYLLRTDPEDAISAIDERLGRAEQVVQSQHLRNEADDLQARMEELKERQEALKAKLGATVGKRQVIEKFFSSLSSSQHDIEATLSITETDRDGETLEERIRALTEFVTLTTSRFEAIERSMQSVVRLKEEFDAFQSRLTPLTNSQSGVKALLHGLLHGSAQLSAMIDALDRDEESTLSARVKQISESKRELSERVARLVEQFATLDTNYKDINALLTKLNTELKARAPSSGLHAVPKTPS